MCDESCCLQLLCRVTIDGGQFTDNRNGCGRHARVGGKGKSVFELC